MEIIVRLIPIGQVIGISPNALKRLGEVARACEDFRVGKQDSVSHYRPSAADFVRLRSRLYDPIDLREDRVLFVSLCARCVLQFDVLGRPMEAVEARDMVIVT